MCTLSLSGIIKESIVDGPGIRYVVFAQGCPHHCEGCQNPQTWPFEGGKKVSVSQIIDEIKENPLISGITLSGGEPFCQAKDMAELARAAHKIGLNVIAYTGYFYERLLELSKDTPEIMELLKQIDVLVDGPFISALKSYELKFKGSSNQRAIDVKKSLEQSKTVLAWE